MLSRRYYQDIAAILGETNASQETISRFSDYFEVDNPRFDSQRFRVAVEKNKPVVEVIK